MQYTHSYGNFQTATTFALTANSTVATLHDLSTHYSGIVQAQIQVEDSFIRFGFSQTPAATTGFRVDEDEWLLLEGWDELKTFNYIRGGTTDATLRVAYFYPYACHPTRG